MKGKINLKGEYKMNNLSNNRIWDLILDQFKKNIKNHR